MTTRILPAIGHTVLLFSGPAAVPLAATITAVLSAEMVNVAAFSADGRTLSGHGSVPLVAPGGNPPPTGAYCLWPPFTLEGLGERDGAPAGSIKRQGQPA